MCKKEGEKKLQQKVKFSIALVDFHLIYGRTRTFHKVFVLLSHCLCILTTHQRHISQGTAQWEGQTVKLI